MRLIDADILRDEILHNSDCDNDTIDYFLDLVDFQPTVDKAVVNCKGGKFSKERKRT